MSNREAFWGALKTSVIFFERRYLLRELMHAFCICKNVHQMTKKNMEVRKNGLFSEKKISTFKAINFMFLQKFFLKLYIRFF